MDACTLASAGPAGVQASWVACMTQELRLYLLLSTSTDHLLNIEATGEVALAGDGWRLAGEGKCLNGDSGPWILACQPWQTVVEVISTRFYPDGDDGHLSKSIDFTALHLMDVAP